MKKIIMTAVLFLGIGSLLTFETFSESLAGVGKETNFQKSDQKQNKNSNSDNRNGNSNKNSNLGRNSNQSNDDNRPRKKGTRRR